jgi:hypothetical protein
LATILQLCLAVFLAQAAAEPPSAPPAAADADLSWLPGNGLQKRPLAFGPVLAELRIDTALHYLWANPADDTLSGSSEAFRHGELQLTHLGLGGTYTEGPVHGRVMLQLGLYSQATPRNDASIGRGQWQLGDAYRYLSEAWAGYRFNVLSGINLQAGLFMSFIGLWSYYNADNWTYQPSFVSSSTPWFFNGIRLQIFVNDRLKIEPWLVNGWQAYGRFNQAPGVGLQVQWRPTSALSATANHYAGFDTPGLGGRLRLHADESLVLKYLDRAGGLVRRAALSLTVDGGCEVGDGASCGSQYFAGLMAYHRLWLADSFAVTVGGGVVTNPGRYLTLLPPINGATAASGTPYFSAALGDTFRAWDAQVSVDYMPAPLLTFRLEAVARGANVPYFAGPRGMTPPGGNQGTPGSRVPGWAPDLRPLEHRVTLALMLRT